MSDYIIDKPRQACLNAVRRHIDRARTSRKHSVLITGEYGCGKSELLKQIKLPGGLIRVRSLGSLYQVLGRMAGDKDAKSHLKEFYLEQRCETPAVIIIDEAQHLPESVYPYLKIIMDAGNCVILAGLPDVKKLLKNKYRDLLSRFTHIELKRLSKADMYSLVSDKFDEDDFDSIYGATEDMGTIISIVENCLDYINEHNLPSVSTDIVIMFTESESLE